MLQTFRRGFHHKTGNDLEGSHRLADPAVTHQYVGSKTSDKRFAHKALDETQSSIRLVTVSSELSSDGSIQCYISHSTLDRASYVCLSYTWGTSEAQSRILINGLPFNVSKNVFDFLDMVRTMPMTFYWIDAMCIDLANVPERNKQVGQMGQIYSKAFLVYLWLGKLPSMVPFMRYFDGSKNAESVKKSFWENTPEARDIVKTQILNHEYWNRAWVVQEICMARAVLVTLCRESFKLPDFISTMRKFDQFEPGSFRNSFFAPFAETVSNISKLHSKSLMNLLDESREKKCAVPRDRIFSMLPLASNFQLPEAKYDQPSEDLAYDVLRRADEPLCICSALLVAQTLRLASKRTLDEDIRGSTITALEFDIRSLRFSRHAMLCNDKIHSWAHYKIIGTDIFGHDLLLTDLCPALYALMGTLQDRAMNKNPTSEEASATPITAVPYLLKMMDEEHAQAILGSFTSTLNIEQHPADQGTTIFRVALRILPKLVPENIPLCRRVALGKARKTEMDREAASPNPYAMDPSFAAQSREARGSRDFRAREASIFRIDSANSNRGFEDDGPVSGLRLRRIPISPSG